MKRKVLALLLALCGIFCLAFALSSCVKIVVREDDSVFYYMKTKDKKAYKVKGLVKFRTENVQIPSEFNGLPVTEIGKGAFENNSYIKSVTIPASIAVIGERAFYSCYEIESLTIPDGVTHIENQAFAHCQGIESLVIPDSVVNIGRYAFDFCTRLESVTIGCGVTEIGKPLFSYCDSLVNITVSSDNPVFNSSGNCVIETESKTLVVGCVGSIIPSDGSITAIGKYAFVDCNKLENISIPDCVTTIGYGSFEGCYNLEGIILPDSVTYIGDWAFGFCSKFENIIIPDGVTYIGECAFNWCKNLESITIPVSVTEIGYSAFYRCESLRNVYYKGTAGQWNEISIGRYNDTLTGAAFTLIN